MDVKENNSAAEIKRLQKEQEENRIASEVTTEYQRRLEERRSVESGWILNLNFFSGNQYCDVSPFGGVMEEDKQFYWQNRRVFNHIAPMVDARVSKLEQVRPELRVRAFSDEDSDLKAANLATGVLKYVRERIGLDGVISKAAVWSETCGSVFYKIVWEEKGGRQVAVDEKNCPVYEGEVKVTAVSPFEIFPDRMNAEDLGAVQSLIHAQPVTVEYIKERFGVTIAGRNISGIMSYGEPSAGKLAAEKVGADSAAIYDGEILMERYTKPTAENPEGRLDIVAGGKLLYSGALPYINGEKSERVFPFVKQDCMRLPGAFFGYSIIDRLIPVQRAYNAVRNRKHEFLNRLSMGILTVEDGSVDTDELAEEGLLPGKVLVYRQGGKAPEMLDCGSVPSEFKAEEEWLEKEFSLISGVSDLFQNSTPLNVTSATGLQLLLKQDEHRMGASIQSMQHALEEVGRQILRLYRQFAGTARMMTLAGENKRLQVHYFNASNLAVNDVQFEAQESNSPDDKRNILLTLYEAGLLSDENGMLLQENKNRILEAFGFGSYENAKDISVLHTAKAGEENLDLKSSDLSPDWFDDHDLHLAEHTRYLLSGEFKRSANKENIKKRFTAHMQAHKKMLRERGTEENNS